MKKTIILIMIGLVAISPLFRGLFFEMESSLFLCCFALLSVLYFMYKLIKKESFQFDLRVLIIGIALIAGYLISFAHATNIRENLGAIYQYVGYFIIFIIFYDFFNDKRDQFHSYVFVPIIISGLICSIIGLFIMPEPLGFLNSIINGARSGSTFQYVNTASIFYSICILLLLSLIQYSANKAFTVLLSGIGAVLFLSFFCTNSMGGFISACLSFLLFLLLLPKGNRASGIINIIIIALPALIAYQPYSKAFDSADFLHSSLYVIASAIFSIMASYLFNVRLKQTFHLNRKIFAAFLLSFFVMIVVLVFFFSSSKTAASLKLNVITEISNLTLKDGSVSSRIDFFKDAMKLISNNWTIGLGRGGWQSLYQSVQESYYISRAVHNHFLQAYVEAGILGLISLTGLCFLIFSYFMIAIKKLQDPKGKIIVAGISAAYVALVTHSFIDFDLSYMSMELIFWLLACGAAVFASGTRKTVSANDIPPKAYTTVYKVFLIALCLVLSLAEGVQSAAALSAFKGAQAMDNEKYQESIYHYERSVSLDPINAEYFAQLGLLYDYNLKESKSYENFKIWSEKAVLAAERSTKLNRYYPANIEILARIYFDAGFPDKALVQAEKLIEYQPCNSSNYELLYRGYMETATKFMEQNDKKSAQPLVNLCSLKNSSPYFSDSQTIKYYRSKALIALKKYDEAEQLLLSIRSSEKYKTYSQILLYSIYEVLGQQDEKKAEYKDLSVNKIEMSALYNEMQLFIRGF